MRQRLAWVLVPTIVTAAITATASYFFMPTRYASESVIMVVPPRVPDALVTPMPERKIEDRLPFISQQILSRTSLSQIIQDPKLDLYRKERAKEPLDDVIDEMQRNIGVQLQVMDATGRHASAFRIWFNYPEKTKARDTVAVLVTTLSYSGDGLWDSPEISHPGRGGRLLPSRKNGVLPNGRSGRLLQLPIHLN